MNNSSKSIKYLIIYEVEKYWFFLSYTSKKALRWQGLRSRAAGTSIKPAVPGSPAISQGGIVKKSWDQFTPFLYYKVIIENMMGCIDIISIKSKIVAFRSSFSEDENENGNQT